MRKVRVYQLARELRMSNEALLELLEQIDSPVSSHMAAVEGATAEQVRERVAGAASRGTRTATRRPAAGTETQAPPAGPGAPRRQKMATKRPSARRPAAVWTMPALPKAPNLGLDLAPTGKVSSAAAPPARRMGSVLPPRDGALRAPEAPPAAAPQRRTGRTYYPPSQPGSAGGPPRAGAGAPPRAGAGDRDRRPGRKGRKKRKRHEPDEREVRDSIRRTMATIDGTPRRRRRRRHGEEEGEVPEEGQKIRVSEFLTVAELASQLGARPAEVVVTCLRMGIVANVNRRLDRDSIEAVADEFGYEVEFIKEFGAEVLEEVEEKVDAEEVGRPVIVTVMGHVDHGKTKLLDYIRQTDVIAGESGGITQHIGAYQVRLPEGRAITFLDTPGHQAFTQMRARGADVTDLVVLVIAADDRVNEQTIEAINHARAARKPIVVAINKTDLANANPEKIKQELSEQGLLVEDWGGEIVAVEISAKQGTNVDKLLEMILLVAEMQELKAQPSRLAKGTVIEARKDPGRGIVATVLVQTGTLRIGDAFVCGVTHGKVRAMVDDTGERVEAAGPARPVELLGWSDMPQVGDRIAVLESEALVRAISSERGQIAREHRMKLAANRFRLDDLHTRIQEGRRTVLSLVIKADVQGSAEVLRDSLEKLSNEQVTVRVIHTGVGKINESDVLLATASNAVIVGFHVRPDPKATQLAQVEGVDVRLYKVIYEAIDQVKDAMSGLLAPEKKERVLGTLEVREVFHITKVGTIAGCHVVTGTVTRQAMARLVRGEDVVWTGRIASLKRFKDDVKEVAAGFDCGMSLEDFNDIQVGDLLEAFVVEEVARKAE